MKKKVLAVVLGVILCFCITGYTKGDVEPKNNKLGNKYIDLVTIYEDEMHGVEVCYDKNTKVMYFIKFKNSQFGITPIYNSDGTVKLYNEK